MKDIHTLRTQFRVSDFVAWQRDDALELNPNFQRRPVWKKKAKSFLIDTILRGLPMPIIFLRDLRSDLRTLKPRRDVVDGQQRIRTIIAYVNHRLLSDFDPEHDYFTIDKAHNPELAGKTFSDLSAEDRQTILDYQFSVHSFAADTDDRDILQIFARMNATGLKLNSQELRNAEWFGQFKTSAYSLATEQLNRWRDWKLFTPDQIARMNEVELISEFMLLIMNGNLGRSSRLIDGFYKYYDEIFPDQAEVASRIRYTLESIENLFTSEELADSFGNRALFYALFTAVYGLHFEIRVPVSMAKIDERVALTRVKPTPLPAGTADQIPRAVAQTRDGTAPIEVLQALRGAVAHEKSRRAIIEHLVGAASNPCPPPLP